MRKRLSIAAIGSILLLAGCAGPAGSTPSGSWSGTATETTSAADNPRAKATASDIPLELSADHTFTLGQSGHTLGGTWKVEADTVTMTITKIGEMDVEEAKQTLVKQFGEAGAETNLNGADKPIVLKLSADGKTMTGKLNGPPKDPAIPLTFTKKESS